MPTTHSSSNNWRGLRLTSGVAFCFALMGGIATGALAQRIGVEPPVPISPVPHFGGIGGGAGALPTMPQIAPAPLNAPQIAPAPAIAPPVAVPQPVAPVAPARVVRFRCQIAPETDSCKEPPAPDGGGSDEDCDCSHDYCYDDGSGGRVCEKQ